MASQNGPFDLSWNSRGRLSLPAERPSPSGILLSHTQSTFSTVPADHPIPTRRPTSSLLLRSRVS
eukprot:4715262-Pleurochrysis_carterae.AAC.1